MVDETPQADLKLPEITGEFLPKTNATYGEATTTKQPGPTILYHYTTGAGLLGILREQAIWATNMRFLNDSAEFQHSLDLAERVLEDVKPAWNRTYEAALAIAVRIVLRDVAGVSTYVISFSEHRDRLSQWRAYGHAGQGYAVGFDMLSFYHLITMRGYSIAPCVYDPDHQVAIVRAILDDMRDSIHKWIEETDGPINEHSMQHFAYMFYVQFMALGPALKDQSFEEEGEWRVMSSPVLGADPKAQFRPARNTLVPYRPFDLSEDGKGRIAELVVGPLGPAKPRARRCAHPRRRQHAAHSGCHSNQHPVQGSLGRGLTHLGS